MVIYKNCESSSQLYKIKVNKVNAIKKCENKLTHLVLRKDFVRFEHYSYYHSKQHHSAQLNWTTWEIIVTVWFGLILAKRENFSSTFDIKKN